MFLEGLEERKLPYVCGVESAFGVRLPEEVVAAKEAGAPPYKGRGQPPKERPAPLYTAEQILGSLPKEAWRTVAWREGTKGTLSKQMVAVRVHRATGSDRMSTTHERVLTSYSDTSRNRVLQRRLECRYSAQYWPFSGYSRFPKGL